MDAIKPKTKALERTNEEMYEKAVIIAERLKDYKAIKEEAKSYVVVDASKGSPTHKVCEKDASVSRICESRADTLHLQITATKDDWEVIKTPAEIAEEKKKSKEWAEYQAGQADSAIASLLQLCKEWEAAKGTDYEPTAIEAVVTSHDTFVRNGLMCSLL